MNKTGKNQHEWGVIAQTHSPFLYREFHYCPLCKKFKDIANNKLLGIREMRVVTNMLALYNPDSKDRFLI